MIEDDTMTSTPTERLKSTVKDLSPARKDIEAELSAEEVLREFEQVLDRYAGRAKLKGFRPGKAPKSMVKQMFGPDIRSSVLDSLVPKVLDEVLAAKAIHPVGAPVIRDILCEEGQPLRFKAGIEVWPEFELPSYKNITVKKREAVVRDEDVDRALEELREKSAEYVPVENRGVARGDYAVIELQGKDRKSKRYLPVEKVVVLAGHGGNDPAINENLIGLKPGEEKTFVHSYPADDKNKKLAGKEIEYRLKVVSVKEKRLAELNDDFARTLGEHESLAGLRETLRQDIRNVREKEARREMAEEAVKLVLERTVIELPPSAVDQEARGILKEWLASTSSPGPAQGALDDLGKQARVRAEANLKRHLVLRKIAEAESLQVSEEEMDEEIREMARASQIPLARAMESFNRDNRREGLRTSLLLRKAIDFLLKQAIIE
jgi:trigger factor